MKYFTSQRSQLISISIILAFFVIVISKLAPKDMEMITIVLGTMLAIVTFLAIIRSLPETEDPDV